MIQQVVIQNDIYLLTFFSQNGSQFDTYSLLINCSSLWISEGKRNGETLIWGNYLQVSEAVGRDKVDTWSEPGCPLFLYRLLLNRYVYMYMPAYPGHDCLNECLQTRMWTVWSRAHVWGGGCCQTLLRCFHRAGDTVDTCRADVRRFARRGPETDPSSARPQVARPLFLLHDCVTAATATAFRSRCYVFYPDKSLRTFDIYRENAIHPGLAGESGLFSHKGCFWAI